ncbi:MAG: hydantoinase B/oxoprolinase family protein [Balneolales bacterium]|nr:hydantoinase B/oxoprolinase family protein [Balneolales bacterium]
MIRKTGQIAHKRPLPLLCIDKGGTFTDCYFKRDDEQEPVSFKLLSSGQLRVSCIGEPGDTELRLALPDNVQASALVGFNVFAEENGEPFGAVCLESRLLDNALFLRLDKPLPFPLGSVSLSSGEDAPVTAARLLTGTPPGRPLPNIQMRLAGTQTTNALLEGKYPKAMLLVSRGFRDLLEIGSQQRPNLFSLRVQKTAGLFAHTEDVAGRMGQNGEITEHLDVFRLRELALKYRQKGITTVAVCLINAWISDTQEKEAAAILKECGFSTVVLSSETAPLIHYHDRAQTTLVNAVLSPVLESWRKDLEQAAPVSEKWVMTSSAGLKQFSQYQPSQSLLSGPAAGVLGAMKAARDAGLTDSGIITFDMGGTSTDVARTSGSVPVNFRHRVGAAAVMEAAVDIETVAAGGGSIVSFDGYVIRTGPESAGALPGPACYGNGGPLTITDLNLLSGALQPDSFAIPVYPEKAELAYQALLEQLKDAGQSPEDPLRLIDDILDIANEKMAGAIRSVSVRKGYNPQTHTLVSYGGAGGQHAIALAEKLGINRVLFPADSSILSAAGLSAARPESVVHRQLLKPLNPGADWAEAVFEQMVAAGAKHHTIEKQKLRSRFVCLIRYPGQNTALQIETEKPESADRLSERFRELYRKRYGSLPATDAAPELESVRLILTSAEDLSSATLSVNSKAIPVSADRLSRSRNKAGFFLLRLGATTLKIPPNWSVKEYLNGSVLAEKVEQKLVVAAVGKQSRAQGKLKAIDLELSCNRLQATADEMGEMLRKTAVSVNIKDRLDYSCAILDSRGQLVANAAHIPVHLGALGVCVRSVLEKATFRRGDTYITNHPAFGGSHLPDVTLITPFFGTNSGKPLGFVASRAHHAEIGGIRPGSMSPDAVNLAEEGCVIRPQRIAQEGLADAALLKKLFTEQLWPSRSVNENIDDVLAALEAGRFGVKALEEWATAGEETFVAELASVLEYGREKMAEAIARLDDGKTYEAEEHLDGGALLKASIRKKGDRLMLDFSGTSPVQRGNLNATPAIVHSVVMYIIRLLVDEPIPLNDGLMELVDVHIPEGSLLNPGFSGDDAGTMPAVFGGNTEVSQRLTDTLIKALELCSCSQGTMNNLVFGNERFGFYETIGGGTGAGPGFDGAHGVHHHMTNTRITDAEILENRYPVRVKAFSLRPGSGGGGLFKGGNGVIRELEFLEPVSLTLLCEHRKVAPFGLKGGKPGQTGEQFVKTKDGQLSKIPGNAKIELNTGDSLILHTPGGGGWGETGDRN